MRLSIVIASLWFASAAHAQEMQPIRTITVNGMAEQKIVPDEAHVVVNLNATNLKLPVAKAAHDAKLKKLMAIVSDHNIDAKKVATQSSNVQPIYRYVTNPANGQNEQKFEGYRVQSSLDITVADTAVLGNLMEAIMQAGFEKEGNPEWGQLISMYYTISNPNAVREQMLIAAIANAKLKATRMAAAADASLKRVFQISEGNVSNFNPRPMPMMAMMEKSMASDAAMAPPAGEQQVNSNVTVTYELE
jgi:uncharacterized protein YggE